MPVIKQGLASGGGESGGGEVRRTAHPRGGKRGHGVRCHSGDSLRTLLGWVAASGRPSDSDCDCCALQWQVPRPPTLADCSGWR